MTLRPIKHSMVTSTSNWHEGSIYRYDVVPIEHIRHTLIPVHRTFKLYFSYIQQVSVSHPSKGLS